jgi:uncharacterized protein (TIGR02217 family)
MTDFHNIQLPDDIESGATGGPMFKTDVVSISSGAEQRNEGWQQSRIRWMVKWGIQEKTGTQGYDRIAQFFYARRGRLYSFLFRDWSDYQATEEVVGTGDGVQRLFHLKKRYGDVENFFDRYITRPDWDTVVVFVNGFANNDWAPGDKGTIVWPEGSEPTGDITWTGEFFAKVRFDVDNFDNTLSALANGEINQLAIIEVRENPNVAPIDVGFANVTDTIAEDASTATRTQVAEVVAIDDDLGSNVFALSGTDVASFEIDTTFTPPRLYLKAGVTLNYEVKSSYSVDVSVQDRFLSDAAVTATFTLNISNVNEPPAINFSNTTEALALGYSTASRVHVADVAVVDDALGSNTLSLSGADAADFEFFGGSTSGSSFTTALYLKAGAATGVARIAVVNVNSNDPAVAGNPDATRQFRLAIGVVAVAHDYDTPGSFTLSCPVYNTLTIETWTPGSGTHGYSPGSTSPPTLATLSRVQNDQTVTALERWRVASFVPPNPTDAATPSTLAATAKMDSFGIGAALDDTGGGNTGGLGYPPLKSAYPGRNLPSGKGGDSVLDGAPVAGGASQTVVTPNASGTTAATANGANGDAPGGGAGGGIYKQTINAVTFSIQGGGVIDDTTDVGMCGGQAGFYAKKVWTWGSVQSGVGADYEASAPAAGDTLYIEVGTGGIGGAGTVTGGNGGNGKVRITVA